MASASQRLTKTVEAKDAAQEALDSKYQEIVGSPFAQVMANHDGTGFDVIGDGQVNNMLTPLAGDVDGMPGSVVVTVPPNPGDATQFLQVVIRVDWIGTSGPRSVSQSVLLSASGAGA